MSNLHFDHVIAGMGCAGLSLAVRMSASGLTKGKRILLIDREKKEVNNRTWCFWETRPGPFESLVHRSWQKAWFHGHDSVKEFSRRLELPPYTYKMIRGIDFFRYCMDQIRKDPAFTVVQDEVKELGNEGGKAFCRTGAATFSADFVFNSIISEKPVLRKTDHYLLQHFKGWIVKTTTPVFNAAEATLMDFRTSQEYGTAFVYVMPFSSQEALVEYTLFTEKLLDDGAYAAGLQRYMDQHYAGTSFEVVEEEFGIIPMTNHLFNRKNGNILHIGTAGGRTKGSTGYTFNFIQQDTERITSSLMAHAHPFAHLSDPFRFRWYDSVLLHILSKGILPGHRIFTNLFSNNRVDQILKFLDNATSVKEELRILLSLPQIPFMMAGLKEGFYFMRR